MDDRLHWFPTIQVSGTGLTLVSSLAPTLGMPIPYWLRVAAFSLGVLMVAWPLLIYSARSLHAVRATLPSALIALAAGALMIGANYWYYKNYSLNGGIWHIRLGLSPAVPPSTPPTPPQLMSRGDRIIFFCDAPTPDAETAAQFHQKLDEAKANLNILADAIGGITFTVSFVRGGIRLDIEITSDAIKNRILMTTGISGLSKFTLEERRIGQVVIVTIYADFPETNAEILFFIHAQPNISGCSNY